MSEVYWLNPISGSFTNAAYWSGDVVPGAADDAILDASGKRRYTVTASTSASINSIQTASNARLAIAAGTFVAAEGTGSGDNAGIILVAAHATLAAGGQITNSGAIEVGGSAHGGSLLLKGQVTLSGGGQVELGASGDSRIDFERHTGPRFAVVTNVDNTISGSGTIGKSSRFFLINDSAGVIDANSNAPLFIYGYAQNNGLVESTGAGGLTFKSINPSGGVFLAENGSTMRIIGPQLDGATLDAEGGGVIMAESFSSYSISTKGKIEILGYNKIFSITQNTNNIDNSGVIDIIGGSTKFYDGCALFGGGTINIESGANITLDRNGGTLTNIDNTIIGGGDIFGSSFGTKSALINESHGLIDGYGSSQLFVGFSLLTVVNAGTIESTGSNGVYLHSSLDNSGLMVANLGTLKIGDAFGRAYSLTSGGTIMATGAGVVVIEDAIVNTGTLSVQVGGTLTANGAVSGDGVVTVNAGTVDFTSSFNEAVTFTGGGKLELAQSQSFTNSVSGFLQNGKTKLDLGDVGFVSAAEATFTGSTTSGVLTVTDGTHTANITLEGDYLGSSFVASSDGRGGVIVVAQRALILAKPTHAFVVAMAGFGPAAGQAVHPGEGWWAPESVLTAPRTPIA